ncbi:zinc metalloproteinase nas-14-like [Clytia hemisphaerica]|uniref:Metalloendopeptidase n=1 Tax=Clytia hemisphaerica TaxID=252671 RepID=A0A7M6DM40_9CNID
MYNICCFVPWLALVIQLTMQPIHGIPMGNMKEHVGGGLENVQFYNEMLPDEIKSHLNGDVYEEEKEEDSLNNFNDDTNLDIQHAPLKKLENKRWPNGVVPYVIMSKEYTNEEKRLIRAGLRDIEAVAPCIRFVEYSDGDPNCPNTHVQVFKGLGCWSLIGRTASGKAQKLALDYYCITEDKGVIMHEFLHVLGFYHEQARPDRDEYIRIFWDRLSDGAEPQFRKTERTDDLGVAYDPVSIMHYPNTAYAKEYGTITMEWKANPKQVLGGDKLSSKDILQLNRLYCDGGKVVTTTKKPNPTTITTKKPTTTTIPITTTTTSTTTTTTTTTPTTTTTTTQKPTTTKKPKTTKQSTTTTITTETPTTTKKTTPITTKPTKKVCGDYYGLSCMNARPGRCSQWMKIRCPRSCNVCTGPLSETCMNIRNNWSNKYCQTMADKGRCQSSNYWTRYQMKTQCTKTCCQRNELYTFRGQRG